MFGQAFLQFPAPPAEHFVGLVYEVGRILERKLEEPVGRSRLDLNADGGQQAGAVNHDRAIHQAHHRNGRFGAFAQGRPFAVAQQLAPKGNDELHHAIGDTGFKVVGGDAAVAFEHPQFFDVRRQRRRGVKNWIRIG
jgi:hypothetical protein